MSDPVETVAEGWTRYYLKSSALLQRDLSVFSDASFETEIVTVDGKNKSAEILDADGAVVLNVATKGLTGSTFELTRADGSDAGRIKINSVLSKTYLELDLSGGGRWTVTKDAHVKQGYSVHEDDAVVARVDLTTLVLKRNYPVDIADSVDLPLMIGLVWALNFAQLRKAGAAGAAAAV